ncbi:MAG: LapA family protein [Betaproteobacteria bacterium]
MRVIRWIVGIVAFLALLVLSLLNAEQVRLRFFNLMTFEAPLIFVVLVAFASGVAAGLLAGAVKAARLKGQLNRLRREHRPAIEPPAPHGAAPGTTPASGPGFERFDLR